MELNSPFPKSATSKSVTQLILTLNLKSFLKHILLGKNETLIKTNENQKGVASSKQQEYYLFLAGWEKKVKE
jgi:hypothetical protein